MNNTINVSYKTQLYSSFLGNLKGKGMAGKSMALVMAEKLSENKQAEQTAGRVKSCMTKNEGTAEKETVSTKEMTLEEYKSYINDRISEFPLNPSRRYDVISISISDAGFEAMKNDPEYEAWVLDSIRQDFAVYNPWSSYCGGNYCIKSYGATKEEYRSETWSMGLQNGRRKSLLERREDKEEARRRLEKKKRLQKLQRKQQEQKRLQRRAFEKAVVKSQVLHQKAISEYFHLKDLNKNPSSTMLVKKPLEAPFIAFYEDLLSLELFLR